MNGMEKRYFSPEGKAAHEKKAIELQQLASEKKQLMGSKDVQENDATECGAERSAMQIDYEVLLARLSELTSVITEIIEIEEQDEVVRIGTTVSYLVDDNIELRNMTIGAYGETDRDLELVAYNSPLASRIIGLEKWESVKIGLGDCTVELEIYGILPPSEGYWEAKEAFYSKNEN